MDLIDKGRHLHREISRSRLYTPGSGALAAAAGRAPWRVPSQPFYITPHFYHELLELGNLLLSFYQACNRLYYDSLRGLAPAWVAEYCDLGKPAEVISIGRLKRFRRLLPPVIRPDIILGEDGCIICELDSLPGGLGMTWAMGEIYSGAGYEIPGMNMLDAFAAVALAAGGLTALVVSDESADYRGEMALLAESLSRLGHETLLVRPEELTTDEDGVWLAERRVSAIYRFFELFDLDNVAGGQKMISSACWGRVAMLPPPKAFLEDKLWLALLWHPILRRHWERLLGEDNYLRMQAMVPQGWIVDGRPLPSHAVIPGLEIGGHAISDWSDLSASSQKERRMVLKPSGFSPLAWGSRGVRFGHDMPAPEWAASLAGAAAHWEEELHILQRFRQGRRFNLAYYDERADDIFGMDVRIRLCPYYFTDGADVEIGGVMATGCSPEKKAIHGMAEAIIAPVAVVKGKENAYI